MIIRKKSGGRNIFVIVLVAALATGAALVFRSHRIARNAPQPTVATPQTAASEPSAEAPVSVVASGTASPASPLTQHTAPLQTRAIATSPLPNISASTAVNTTAATTTNATDAALAALSPRERAVIEKIPSARFREDVLSLTPDARALVLKTLAAKPVPAADYASLHVTSRGVLYYVCKLLPHIPGNSENPAPGEIRVPDDTTPEAAPVSITQPPIRHSRPGSRNILFLDFGGMEIANTAWNEMEKGVIVPAYDAKPYDLDGYALTFNDQEQQNIIQIWERVAEHFSAFDVDVTTEKPAAFNRTTGHALITSGTDKAGQIMPAGDKAGGVALLNFFGEHKYHTDYSPAFIYYDKLASSNANIAYAVSHELGHNLGLSHDGPGTTLGDDDDNGYYTGHGYDATSWAPIMGAGYSKKIIQWSKGEYYKANNHEDDLAIIEGKLGYRGKLAASAPDTAAPLIPLESGLLGATGVIRHAGDAHYYSINLASSGSISFALEPCRLPDLGTIIGSTDLKLEILNASGNPYAIDNLSTATNASLVRQLNAGQWYVRVSSEGTGGPMSIIPTGYTAYGSIGQYTLDTNLVHTRPTLAAALNSNLTWKTESGSASEWFGQTATTHDGIAAAQTGPVDQDQSTGIFATVEGPGTVSFWWKTDSYESDYLAFVTREEGNPSIVFHATLSGQQDWRQRTFTITSTGTHHFGWTFDRARIIGNPLPNITGSAWVDQVVWIPTGLTFNTTPASKETSPDAGQFTIAIETNKTWTAATDADWLALSATTGNGDTTLTVAHAANDTSAVRHGAIIITSAGINRTCEIAQPARIPFATALDNNLAWTTGNGADGGHPWATQTITTHDGRHAARTGIVQGVQQPGINPQLDRGQETWLKTTVNGPGTISFWWKVSSEEEATDETGTWGDILHFNVDGVERTRTSGEKDWAARIFAITGTGAHELKWSYKKDPYLAVGADGAWLDQVTWTTGTAITLNASPDTKQLPATGGAFTVTVDSNIAWNATSSASWLTLSPSAGTGSGTLNITHLANTATTTRTGIITITAAGLADTCTVTQAAFASGTSANNNNNNNSGGGGGGGAPSLWGLCALGLLLLIRTKRSK